MERQKVLIVSIWDTGNFGNRLQNYALQQVLTEMGYDVYSAIADKYPIPAKVKVKKRIKILLAKVGVDKYKTLLWRKQREKLGSAFNRMYIQNQVYVGKFVNAYKKDFSSYAYAVAGSDQIWHNWYKDPYELKYYGLTFMPKERRIAYGGSFGFDTVPEEYLEEYSGILSGYKTISVREDSGVSIVNKLTSREAEVVLDPTLLLTSGQWMEIEKKPAFLKDGKYALIYALGTQNESFSMTVEELRSEGYKIVDLLAKDPEVKLPEIDAAEFVYLIHHAEMVLTDSFHATVFSLIFHRNLRVFQRSGEDMSSRIKTLVNTAGLADWLENGDTLFKIDSSDDYEKVDARMKIARETSLEYLYRSMRGGVETANNFVQ